MMFNIKSHSVLLASKCAALCVLAAFCAVLGTFAHRMGAMYGFPYGLVIALLLVTLSACFARMLCGMFGFILHAIVCCSVVWMIALGWFRVFGAFRGVLVAIGFGVDNLPWIAQNAGYFWLYGIIIVHVVLLCMPNKFFVISGAK